MNAKILDVDVLSECLESIGPLREVNNSMISNSIYPEKPLNYIRIPGIPSVSFSALFLIKQFLKSLIEPMHEVF